MFEQRCSRWTFSRRMYRVHRSRRKYIKGGHNLILIQHQQLGQQRNASSYFLARVRQFRDADRSQAADEKITAKSVSVVSTNWWRHDYYYWNTSEPANVIAIMTSHLRHDAECDWCSRRHTQYTYVYGSNVRQTVLPDRTLLFFLFFFSWNSSLPPADMTS